MESIRVLLADDHAEFRRVVADFLKKIPHVLVVGEASSGPDAVTQVEKLRPDLVLMDISMPGSSGLEATRIIKQRWPSTRVLIATMHENPIYRLQAKEVNADGYVIKSDLKSALELEFGVSANGASMTAPTSRTLDQ